MSPDLRSVRQVAIKAIDEQRSKTITVLSSLLAVQDALQYLPREGLEEVASRTGSSVNDVWGVASFYPNFRFKPPTEHIIEVCWGPPCHLLGAQTLLQEFLTHLGLKGEGDTPDGLYTLKMNTCLGACPHGPVMSFDHKIEGHITFSKAIKHLENLSALKTSKVFEIEKPINSADSER